MTRGTTGTRRRHLLAAVLTAAVLGATAAGCGAPGEERPRVVVTTNILGDVTREVIGDEAEVTVLMRAGADPHSFGLSAVEAAMLEEADLVVHNGMGLEENVVRHVEAAAGAGVATVAVGEAADPLPYRGEDGSGAPDPHFWTDPDRMRTATAVITEQVLEHVPDVDADTIRANAESYDAELAELTEEMTDAFGAIPEEDRKLVTNHHVFGYLAERFDFEVIGAIVPGGTTLASPSSSDLASLTEAMRQAGVRAVFADSSQPDRLAQVLREELGGTVEVVPLFTESLTEPGEGAGTYLEMMRANTAAITDGLTRTGTGTG
ncbi:zinc ABC transporter substrate-binding protein AztC [Streptomyces spiramenti]|uniref:Zinc ABC transporter substrate-binding protein n=1 Tax=Streptomyces spiramenti TaxID=2720606 RepID=A0ABX1AF50_9ACTN|nr:zinc ABC transporter substrate-binding protein AztC [Streptomyces spiramenti]NJP65829.1 zinc ABC transporter substrate-binding protein [Streptomyces spiramenti]